MSGPIDPSTGEVVAHEASEAHVSKFPKTVRAMQREEALTSESGWTVVDAMAEEVGAGEPEYGDLKVLATEAQEAGVEREYQTIYRYFRVARLLNAAADDEREVLRSAGVTALAECAVTDMTATDVAVEILGAQRFTQRYARQVRNRWKAEQNPQPSRQVDDPTTWGSAEWEKFDKDAAKALLTVARAIQLKDQGHYHPSTAVDLMLTAVRPSVDWDDELAKLTEGIG